MPKNLYRRIKNKLLLLHILFILEKCVSFGCEGQNCGISGVKYSRGQADGPGDQVGAVQRAARGIRGENQRPGARPKGRDI